MPAWRHHLDHGAHQLLTSIPPATVRRPRHASAACHRVISGRPCRHRRPLPFFAAGRVPPQCLADCKLLKRLVRKARSAPSATRLVRYFGVSVLPGRVCTIHALPPPTRFRPVSPLCGRHGIMSGPQHPLSGEQSALSTGELPPLPPRPQPRRPIGRTWRDGPELQAARVKSRNADHAATGQRDHGAQRDRQVQGWN
jgi:hypothetical protein